MAKFSLLLNWSIFVVNECVQKRLVYIATMYDKKLRFFLNLSISPPSHPEYTYSVNIGSRD